MKTIHTHKVENFIRGARIENGIFELQLATIETQPDKNGYTRHSPEQVATKVAGLENRFKRLRDAPVTTTDSSELVNIHVAAKLADVDEADIRRAVSRGELRKRLVERQFYIRIDDLEDWVKWGFNVRKGFPPSRVTVHIQNTNQAIG